MLAFPLSASPSLLWSSTMMKTTSQGLGVLAGIQSGSPSVSLVLYVLTVSSVAAVATAVAWIARVLALERTPSPTLCKV